MSIGFHKLGKLKLTRLTKTAVFILHIMSKRLFENTKDGKVDATQQQQKKIRRSESTSKNKNRKNAITTAVSAIESTKPNLWLRLLSCGYIRKYLTRNVNPSDIGSIVAKFLFQDWKFDYLYDYGNQGPAQHGIRKNGKKIQCSTNDNRDCNCFYSMFSYAMKPQSGKYKIKFKIEYIWRFSYGNTIGIISENCKNDEKIKNNESSDKNMMWSEYLHDYIGWSSFGRSPYFTTRLHGLFYGDEQNFKNNIFCKNNFRYCSNNENYQKGLPEIRSNDIIVLEYDSDLSILSFSKENDNGILNSYISNLPKNETFYWFVGHQRGGISLTVHVV